MERTEKRTWVLRVLFGVFVVSVSMLIALGCSKNPLTSVSNDTTQTTVDWFNNNVPGEGTASAKVVPLQACSRVFDTVITQQVCQWGYQINVVHGAEVIGFSLPYMAVPGPVVLTIHATEFYSPQIGKFWIFDCGPSGQTFKYPLYVQPNAAARNGSTVVLLYWDPSQNTWVIQDVETASQNQPVQVPIYHFSKYAIS